MVYAFTIQPGIYHAFEDEAEQIEQCKEWGLLSGKATKTKAFFYKGNGLNVPCTIVGYTDRMTAVIEFDNKQQHCIHPSYLKEMQAANYGQRQWSSSENATEADASEGTMRPGMRSLQVKFRRIRPLRLRQPPSRRSRLPQSRR